MHYTEQQFKEDLQFISSYLEMEKFTLAKTKKYLREILPPRKFEHLNDSWIGRYDREKKVGQFGSFFTNIEHKTQAIFIKNWGIDIPYLDEYLEVLNSSPIASITTTPPVIIERLHYLLVFFLNHGIDEVVDGYSMVKLPKERYGNAHNWGNYILSLNTVEQFGLLSHLAKYCKEGIEDGQKNRDMLKNAKMFTHSLK